MFEIFISMGIAVMIFGILALVWWVVLIGAAIVMVATLI